MISGIIIYQKKFTCLGGGNSTVAKPEQVFLFYGISIYRKRQKFNHSDLESDEDYEGNYSDSTCPECDFWDCCECELETKEDALKRIKIN